MKTICSLGLLCLLTAPRAGAADSFVQNEQDRAKIEAALPLKPYAQPAKPRRLLIFTLNVGYGGHPSMAYANEAFSLMGKKTGAFETVVSNDPKVFERESLGKFDAVFFNNTVGNCFTNADLRKNLVEFVLAGGGLLGVHGSTVAFTHWPGAIEDWPEFGYMIGARGANHKDSDEHIVMKLDDPENPILSVFGGQTFDFRDEFFRPQGTYSRQRVRVLLSIDTDKCDPEKGQARGDCFRPDHDYAVAWIRSYGKGRVFYCTIAHNPYVFWDAKMLSFYLGALQFALGDLPCPTLPSARLTAAARAEEKLGWRLAVDASAKGVATLAEAGSDAARLNLAYVIGSQDQPIAAHLLRPLSPSLSDTEMEQVRLKLEQACVRLLAYRVTGQNMDETAARDLFRFGRRLGTELLIVEHPPRSLELWAQLAQEFDTKVAFCAGSRREAEGLAKACREQGRNLGVALDLHTRALWKEDPKPFLAGVGNRLLFLALPDAPQQLDRVVQSWASQVRALDAKPIFSMSSESAEKVRPMLDSTALKLSQP